MKHITGIAIMLSTWIFKRPKFIDKLGEVALNVKNQVHNLIMHRFVQY